MVKAFTLAQDNPIQENIDAIVGIPPGSADVGGTALQAIPGGIIINLSALAVANDIVAVQNPFARDVLITDKTIRVKTAGGSATAVLDVDVVDGPTDTGDGIFDGVDANAAGVTGDKAAGAGTNAEHTSHLWEKAGATLDHLSIKLLVANAANLVAYLTIMCQPADMD